MKRFLAFAVIASGIGWVVSRSKDEPIPRLPTSTLREGEIVTDVPHGESVDVGDHLRAGKWTLVEFRAPW
ncbi:MAG: hypothetical protein ACREID_05120 [Planctomycetota bacterium]